MQLVRLRALCPGAELWEDTGGVLVYLPGLSVESKGARHKVDGLLSPGPRDGYENRLYFSAQLPIARNWNSYALKARNWFAISWRGIRSDAPWLDILAGHLEAVK